jgi:hypothetical protein
MTTPSQIEEALHNCDRSSKWVAVLAAEVERLTAWRPMAEAPRDGTFLVQLEEEVLNSKIHVATFHPNINMIGGHFEFDMPKAIGWLPLPSHGKAGV